MSQIIHEQNEIFNRNINNERELSKNPWVSLVVQLVKNLPAMQETEVQVLDREDLLEKKMATHSSILVWRIPWTEEPGGLVHGVTKSWKHLSD